MRTLYKNIKLIDGTFKSNVIENVIIVTDDDLISYVGKKEDYKLKVDKVVDLKNQYVVPGLINLHAHLPGSGSGKSSPNAKKFVKLILSNKLFGKIGEILCYKNAKLELLSGVTTLRCVGGVGHIDTLLRDKINAHKKIGPRMIVADYALAYKEGHMTGTVSKEVTNNIEAKEAIDDLIAHKVDFIKLMITTGALDSMEHGEPGVLRIPSELAKFIVDYSHEKGLKVAAHVEGKEGMELAIKIGIDTIEHGAGFSNELIDEIRNKKLVQIITLSPCFDLPKEYEINEMWKNVSKIRLNVIECAKQFIINKLDYGFGNDVGCPYTAHYNYWRELYFATKYLGLSNEEVIYGSCYKNAKILGLEKQIGTIEQNKKADFIVLRENPLANIFAYKYPSYVVKDGHIYKSKFKRNKSVEICQDRVSANLENL